MLINTLSGWKRLDLPSAQPIASLTSRAKECRMADETAELCPSLSRAGAQLFAGALARASGVQG